VPRQNPLLAARFAKAATDAWTLTTTAQNELCEGEERDLIHLHFVPALRHCLLARDLCPLLAEPQEFLANHGEELAQGDSRLTYLERTKILAPHRPMLWYLCGNELLKQQPDQAWTNWRRSLELSELWLPQIL